VIEGRYRYRLDRWWEGGEGRVCWIMLNPSTADATQDDPTIRRCITFSKAWGYASLVVVNLFALRATDPKALRLPAGAFQDEYLSIIGPENDDTILAAEAESQRVVAAWGNHGSLHGRGADVREMLRTQPLHLGLTKTGEPRHPLYARADTQLARLAWFPFDTDSAMSGGGSEL
jgi:hypothetical protein